MELHATEEFHQSNNSAGNDHIATNGEVLRRHSEMVHTMGGHL